MKHNADKVLTSQMFEKKSIKIQIVRTNCYCGTWFFLFECEKQ